MRSPMRPVPESLDRWISRARFLRWVDAAVAGVVLWAVVAAALPRPAPTVAALAALVLLVLLARVPLFRVRWRPASACVGVAMTRRLRPGDRAWWIQSQRVEAVVVTARRGLRLTIATARHRESEGLSVRRTRALIVPADDA